MPFSILIQDLPGQAIGNWPRHFVGLDLGQRADFTALTVLERHGDHQTGLLLLRHIERWPLHTAYPQIVREVEAMLAEKAFWSNRSVTPEQSPRPCLIIDGTGCGAAVVDLFREAKPRAHLFPVLITGGHAELLGAGGYWHVPKGLLVSATQAALQTGRLKIAKALLMASTLRDELLNFKIKISVGGHETFEAWREREHDDLVLAAALACWAATNRRVSGEWKVSTWRR